MTRALVVVAHPDDETIWMGGTIIRNSFWNWTILSLCRSDDEDRSLKFYQACNFYRAKVAISNLEDEKLLPLPAEEIKVKIRQKLERFKYDYIFTHGENGEYGHLRHKEVHHAVSKMVESGELRCEKLFCFSYKPSQKQVSGDGGLRIPFPKKEGTIFTKLNVNEFQKKKEIIQSTYGFHAESFENLSCHQSEAFTVK